VGGEGDLNQEINLFGLVSRVTLRRKRDRRRTRRRVREEGKRQIVPIHLLDLEGWRTKDGKGERTLFYDI